MKRLVLLTLMLGGCSDELGPEGQAAQRVCDAYVAACQPAVAEACFQEYALFAGHEVHGECATDYLIGRTCQTDNGCDNEACGDPYDDLIRCVEMIERQRE